MTAALAICDVNMPNMNGLSMVAEMRKDPKLATVPVMILTTEGQPELIAQAKTLGVKVWIVKPFKAPLLLAAVKRITGVT